MARPDGTDPTDCARRVDDDAVVLAEAGILSVRRLGTINPPVVAEALALDDVTVRSWYEAARVWRE